MTTAFVCFNWFQTVNNTNKQWNNIAYNAATPVSLVDSGNVATGWSVTKPATATGSGDGANSAGSGDAAWADEAGVLGGGWRYDNTTGAITHTISGLDNTKTYNLGFVGSVETQANRIADVTIDGVTKQVIGSDGASVPNTTEAALFTGISPTSGEIAFTAEQGAGSTGGGYVNAFYIEEVIPGPSLTVTQTELTPGGTISGSYSNYETVPTTLTVSDGTNTITIASPTINDNGDGTGTFSGTMPSLPTSGTANLVLFGDVTVELS